MRLDKLLANMGFGSRKDVKALLKEKRVTVNGKVIRNSSIHIDPLEDQIFVDEKKVIYRPYIYIMMNKARGYVSATEDNRDKTVIDLLAEEYKHYGPFPVGRLDKDTEGLLLLTNDGQLAHHLTSPKKGIEKTYFAIIDGRVTEEDKQAFLKGVTLDDGYVTKPGYLTILESGKMSKIELIITEGKFHQVKRMFASVGKKVTYLKRIQMGELTLDPSLALGEYRELNEKELAYCLSLKGSEGEPNGSAN